MLQFYKKNDSKIKIYFIKTNNNNNKNNNKLTSSVAISKNVHMLRAMDPKWKGSLTWNNAIPHDA